MVDRTGLHTAPVPGNPNPLGTAPVDGRLVQAALFGSIGQCLNGGGLTASSTTMAFTIAAGVYQIPDTANGGAVYHSPIDSAVLTPAAGQAGGRIDSIYVLQQDYEKNGSTSRVIYGLVAGTAGSGTAPSLSGIAGGPMRLANITVPASATKASDCTVTWVVPPAVLAIDGPVVANKPLLDLILGSYPGQRAVIAGTGYRWTGSAWQVMKDGRMVLRAKNTASRTVPAGTWTTMIYDVITSDATTQMNGGVGNVALPWAGIYRVLAKASFNGGNSTAPAGIRVKLFDALNGVSYPSFSGVLGYRTDWPFELNGDFAANAGSTLQIEVVQETGATQTVNGYTDDFYRQTLTVEYLGPAS